MDLLVCVSWCCSNCGNIWLLGGSHAQGFRSTAQYAVMAVMGAGMPCIVDWILAVVLRQVCPVPCDKPATEPNPSVASPTFVSEML
jgi:hypothetical protein